MGLKDVLKTVAEGVVAYGQTVQNNYQEYRTRYECYPDHELLRLYKSASGMKKYAIAILLKERGYDSRDVSN